MINTDRMNIKERANSLSWGHLPSIKSLLSFPHKEVREKQREGGMEWERGREIEKQWVGLCLPLCEIICAFLFLFCMCVCVCVCVCVRGTALTCGMLCVCVWVRDREGVSGWSLLHLLFSHAHTYIYIHTHIHTHTVPQTWQEIITKDRRERARGY